MSVRGWRGLCMAEANLMTKIDGVAGGFIVTTLHGLYLMMKTQFARHAFRRATTAASLRRIGRSSAPQASPPACLGCASSPKPLKRQPFPEVITTTNRANRRTPKATLASDPFGLGNRTPTTLVEQILAGICAEVLDVDIVGMDESFSGLGGDSLSAMRAIAAINSALDVRLAVPALINAPSIGPWASN